MKLPEKEILAEVEFKATGSGGPGGQHANKTSTKIQLNWSLSDTEVFDKTEKNRLAHRLENRLTQDGIFQLASGETRSQHKNKEIVSKRFLQILKGALQKPKMRKKTKKPKKADKKRLEEKGKQAEKKKNRKDPLK